AEDGIRDLYVTGVQTCALPISSTAPVSPDTSGFFAATQARLTAWRVAKLSVQSATMSAAAASGASSVRPTRSASWTTRTSGLTEIGRASCRERVKIAEVDGPVE